MVTFRNNNNNNNARRSGFRRNTRNFKSNGENSKFGSNFSNSDNFKRKSPGRNNHNAPKLIDKYNDLAREALSNGDKIERFTDVGVENNSADAQSNIKNFDQNSEKNILKTSNDEDKIQKKEKSQPEIS